MRHFCIATSIALFIVAPITTAQGLGVVYDAGNRMLGHWDGGPRISQPGGQQSFNLITPRGYRVLVFFDAAGVFVNLSGEAFDGGAYGGSAPLFETIDCTGTAFTGVQYPSGRPSLQTSGGVVYRYGATQSLYYVAPLPPIATRLIRSEGLQGPNCVSYGTPQPIETAPTLPNDPGVTGFPNPPYLLPLRFEIVPLSQFFEIFRDSFEASQLTSIAGNTQSIG